MDDQDLSAPSVEARMYQLIFGYMAIPAIGVAAKLRKPDLIADSAMTAEELAGLTNADAPSLESSAPVPGEPRHLHRRQRWEIPAHSAE